jgi:hypothetical protein
MSITPDLDLEENVTISPIPGSNVTYSTGYLLNGGSKNMTVNGSGTTQTFEFAPTSGVMCYLESMSMFIHDNGSVSPNKFGNVTALSNGLQIQVKANGSTTELMNMQDNIDIVTLFGSFNSLDASSGFYNGEKTLEVVWKPAAPIKLDGDNSDFVRANVRDNLSSLLNLRIAYLHWMLV